MCHFYIGFSFRIDSRFTIHLCYWSLLNSGIVILRILNDIDSCRIIFFSISEIIVGISHCKNEK